MLYEPVVRVLVEEFNADVCLTLLNGSQAIHSTAATQRLDEEAGTIIDILLNSGVNVNVPNDDGRTPLHWAAEKGSSSAVRALLQRGARLDLREKETNMTPLDLAKMKYRAEPEGSRMMKHRKQVLEQMERGSV